MSQRDPEKLDLEKLWEEHTQHEFATRDTEATLDTMVEDLDDAAIERSIAEINEAIKRSAARKT